MSNIQARICVLFTHPIAHGLKLNDILTPLRKVLVIFIVTGIVVGCASKRTVSTEIPYSPRHGLVTTPPLLGAIYDGRSSDVDDGVAAMLQQELSSVYPSAFVWTNYFSVIPAGQVAVRVRIVALGAQFGSRLIASASFASAQGSAQLNAAGPWGPVVGTISAQQSVLSGSITGEGWWNGAAWLDLEIEDTRGEVPIRFTIPIAAEHQESNIWGYASGDKAARVAWDRVVSQLVRTLDSVLRTVRDQEQQ